jgi:hypothetical protein
MSTKELTVEGVKAQVTIMQVAQMLNLPLAREKSGYRMDCPVHGGDRSLVVTPTHRRKDGTLGSFYCRTSDFGGDSVGLYAHVEQCKMSDAVRAIAEHYGIGPQPSTAPSPPKQEKREAKAADFDIVAYLAKLDPEHEALAGLDLSADTLPEFRAGYCNNGGNRGRLAFACCTMNGDILAFCGRALDDTPPVITFPRNFDALPCIFGADKVKEGTLYVTNDPLKVMKAYENGHENVVAVLTELISRPAVETLAVLMDERKCDGLELF